MSYLQSNDEMSEEIAGVVDDGLLLSPKMKNHLPNNVMVDG